MTDLLEQAFSEAAKLSEDEQRALAEWLLEELRADRRWETLLRGSTAQLGDLADEAVTDHRRGGSKSLDPDLL